MWTKSILQMIKTKPPQPTNNEKINNHSDKHRRHLPIILRLTGVLRLFWSMLLNWALFLGEIGVATGEVFCVVDLSSCSYTPEAPFTSGTLQIIGGQHRLLSQGSIRGNGQVNITVTIHGCTLSQSYPSAWVKPWESYCCWVWVKVYLSSDSRGCPLFFFRIV